MVRTKKELEETLEWVERSPLNWVVEVESNIERNTEFHRFLQTSVTQVANRAFLVVSKFTSMCGQGSDNKLEICSFEFFVSFAKIVEYIFTCDFIDYFINRCHQMSILNGSKMM